MGIYKRENSIYYLQVFHEGRNRRISLETKNKRFGQDMYDSFACLSTIFAALGGSEFHETHPSEQKTIIKSIQEQ